MITPQRSVSAAISIGILTQACNQIYEQVAFKLTRKLISYVIREDSLVWEGSAMIGEEELRTTALAGVNEFNFMLVKNIAKMFVNLSRTYDCLALIYYTGTGCFQT